jgi:hypothetical protein
MWRRMGNGDTAPRIFNPGTNAGESTSHLGRCTVGQRLPDTQWIVDGPQNRSDRCGEEKNNIFPLSEIKLHFPGRPVGSIVTILTEL